MTSTTPLTSGPPPGSTSGPITDDSPSVAGASSRRQREGIRSTTIVWGLVLMAAGALVVAVGLGYRMDVVTFAVIVSAGLGVALLLLAVLPRRQRPQATVTVYEPSAGAGGPGEAAGAAEPSVAPTRTMPFTPVPTADTATTERIATTAASTDDPAGPAAPTEQLVHLGTAPDPTEPSGPSRPVEPSGPIGPGEHDGATEVLEADRDGGDWWNPRRDPSDERGY